MHMTKKSIVLMILGSTLLCLPSAIAESIKMNPYVDQHSKMLEALLTEKQALVTTANKLKLENAFKSPEVNMALSGLKQTLDSLNYDDAVKQLMGNAYKNGSIFDQDFQKKLPSIHATSAQA